MGPRASLTYLRRGMERPLDALLDGPAAQGGEDWKHIQYDIGEVQHRQYQLI